MDEFQEKFMLEAIALSGKNLEAGHGGPFGALVVRGGRVLGRGYNQVILRNDPTAHAEIIAIREACESLNSYELTGCSVYSSCEPCPMCLGALYWARVDCIYYGCSREDAAQIGFDDQEFYRELNKPREHRSIRVKQILRPQALEIFEQWEKLEEKPWY